MRCSARSTRSARPSCRRSSPSPACSSASGRRSKVMMQLLVDQRETLKVGDIVPVGDLFDVSRPRRRGVQPRRWRSTSTTPSGSITRSCCRSIEKQHGVARSSRASRTTIPRRSRVPATTTGWSRRCCSPPSCPRSSRSGRSARERLAALNHGTIRTPIAGREGQEVLRRCRNWAASVGEIRIGEETNPTISLQLSGVDTESIIKQAEGEDRQGNRVRQVRQMLFKQISVQGEGQIEQYYELLWKNTKRRAPCCSRIFATCRTRPSRMRAATGSWSSTSRSMRRGYGPKDDLSKLQAFGDTHPKGARTICWVPAFFSQDAQKDLGRLVILEHILTGDRYAGYSSQLSPQDRQSAKSLLENQRSILRSACRATSMRLMDSTN